ncbi:MAG: hypothetical protein Q8M94_06045, partial [Ignavibacteria bacterium]|nr:hypothetical protein [Ignavibacteria bacterium]
MKMFNTRTSYIIQIAFGMLAFSFFCYPQNQSKEDDHRGKPYKFIFSINSFQNVNTVDALAVTKI